jgi:hypothetical protein
VQYEDELTLLLDPGDNDDSPTRSVDLQNRESNLKNYPQKGFQVGLRLVMAASWAKATVRASGKL